MTRGELVAELLGTWEECAQRMERDGYTAAAKELRIAIGVLDKTYSAAELMGMERGGITPDKSYCEEYD